ncbi:MAG: hypothetical protein HRU28_18140 [Rhizobiales bacterium]|nr:hypothetical protein [Hyphomicrobiales bacterium]
MYYKYSVEDAQQWGRLAFGLYFITLGLIFNDKIRSEEKSKKMAIYPILFVVMGSLSVVGAVYVLLK